MRRCACCLRAQRSSLASPLPSPLATTTTRLRSSSLRRTARCQSRVPVQSAPPTHAPSPRAGDRRRGRHREWFVLFRTAVLPQRASRPPSAPPARRCSATIPGTSRCRTASARADFDVPESAWARMSPDEQWAANQRFLDRTIARGNEIRLSTRADRARPGSFYERELEYLISKAYMPNRRGTRLNAPG